MLGWSLPGVRRVRRERRERSDINFGLGGAPWVSERVLERYELIYEIDLALEALRVRDPKAAGASMSSEKSIREPGSWTKQLGQPMALDHRRILATALGRLRGQT